MKANFRTGLGAALLTLAAGMMSCSDYLDVKPLAVETPEAIFSTVSGATSAVIGAYAPLAGDNGYGNRLSSFYPFDSDEMQSSQGGDDAGAGRRGIARYSSLPTNAEIERPWNQLYQGIGRANTCIRYIPEMSQYKGGPDQAAVQRLHGEALVLRAQYYFELVRNWGDVPAPFTQSEAGQDFNLVRTDRDEIYERLLSDLALAQDLLPWRTAVAGDERISKGAAKALRARIALYRGGFSLRQDGSVRRGSDHTRYYEIARTECADLMAERMQHDLNTSYEETFRSINELRRDLKREIIFEASMGGSSAANDSKLGYYNGPRINNSPRFGLSSGAIVALPTYFYAFDSTDVRRDVTLAPYTIESNDLQRATTLINVYDGKFRRDWRMPIVSAPLVQSLGYNWPLIRFADVLLMYAEAQNELAGPDVAFRGVSARQALMEVRLRGFGGNAARAAAAGNPPAGQAGFFTALVNERFLEFGGEGIRKYDLIRWNLLTSRLAQTKADLTDMLPATMSPRFSFIPLVAYFQVVPATGQIRFVRSLYRPAPATPPTGATSVNWRSSITAARIADIASGYTPLRQLLPIPAAALNTNNKLIQNPGY